ncbi:hypothetical protein RHS04_06235 [Rhizoctonia solani]|uniref:Uncharacterized protein n=1 Tax=Rhizoctonia solani TaxID=456999 RepID=A0A8H7H848_9AGAM|nr:hypothetical protein RHS04_06235 [Rhizoctonia solani]
MQHYMPLSSFEDQRDAGLTSAHFDIESLNIAAGDSRSGLDETGAAEVQRIMQEERVGFDEARLIRQKRYLAANGIDPNTGSHAARLESRDTPITIALKLPNPSSPLTRLSLAFFIALFACDNHTPLLL